MLFVSSYPHGRENTYSALECHLSWMEGPRNFLNYSGIRVFTSIYERNYYLLNRYLARKFQNQCWSKVLFGEIKTYLTREGTIWNDHWYKIQQIFFLWWILKTLWNKIDYSKVVPYTTTKNHKISMIYLPNM